MMRLRNSGGDGDQSYFGERFEAEQVDEDWFPGILKRGSAWLVRIVSGNHCGEYLALTSRVNASLEEQMAVRNHLSVVVQVLTAPGPGFVENEITAPAIGMTVVEVLTPPSGK